jgi:hypothetical protein
MVLRRAAPPGFYNPSGATCSLGNPAPNRDPGLKRTQIGTIKKIIVNTTFKLKINVMRNPLNVKSIQ